VQVALVICFFAMMPIRFVLSLFSPALGVCFPLILIALFAGVTFFPRSKSAPKQFPSAAGRYRKDLESDRLMLTAANRDNVPSSNAGERFLPGWYPDPNDQLQQRWWNGESWTLDMQTTRPSGTSSSGSNYSPAKGLLPLKIIAAFMLTSIPSDAILLHWIHKASAAKQSCSTPLPRLMLDLGTFVPLFFVLGSFTCLLIGIVSAIRARGPFQAKRKSDALIAVACSIPSLVISCGLALLIFFEIGFSTWCF
jgi:hypothetical protein